MIMLYFIAFIQWVKRFEAILFLKPEPAYAPIEKKNTQQGGYILLIVLLIFVVLGGLITAAGLSFSYYHQVNRFYALGQKIAIVSRAAHFYAQEKSKAAIIANCDPEGPCPVEDFRLDNDSATPPSVKNISIDAGGNSLIGMNLLPGSFLMEDMPGIEIDISIFGLSAPFSDGDKLSSAAPTAFVVVDLTLDDDILKPSYFTALKAGAMEAGLPLGFPLNDLISETPEPCGLSGTDAYVRWGESQLDCLTKADFDAITGGAYGTLNYYDMVAPAWIAAQSKQDKRALYRFPQPGIPDANIMNTDLDLDGNSIGCPNESPPKPECGTFFFTTNELQVTENEVFEEPVTFRGKTTFCGSGAKAGCQVIMRQDLNVASGNGSSQVKVEGRGVNPATDYAVDIGGDLLIAKYLNVKNFPVPVAGQGQIIVRDDPATPAQDGIFEVYGIMTGSGNDGSLNKRLDATVIDPVSGTPGVMQIGRITTNQGPASAIFTDTNGLPIVPPNLLRCVEMGVDPLQCPGLEMGVKEIEVLSGNLYMGSSNIAAYQARTAGGNNDVGVSKIIMAPAGGGGTPELVMPASGGFNPKATAQSVQMAPDSEMKARRIFVIDECFGACPNIVEPDPTPLN